VRQNKLLRSARIYLSLVYIASGICQWDSTSCGLIIPEELINQGNFCLSGAKCLSSRTKKNRTKGHTTITRSMASFCLDALSRELSTLEASLSGFIPALHSQSYKAKVSAQIVARDLAVIKRLYEQHAIESKGLSETGLCKMLRDLNHHIGMSADQDIHNLFALHDLDHNGFLDFEECYRIIEIPSPIHHWFSTVNLDELLTDCFEAMREIKHGRKEPRVGDFEFLMELTAFEIKLACDEFAQVLVHRLVREIENIRRVQRAELDRDSKCMHNSSKFCVFPMNCGGIDDFHAGLEGRLGTKTKKSP
jgi:hypothetical protein